MRTLGPRVVVAGVSSGVGKTTVATGLLAALTRRGVKAAGAKVGPDFIDPGYHALACGRPPRNLDPWLCGTDAIAPLAARAAADAEVLIVEGVMGLFDGASDGTPSSTADVAVLLDAPVLLVVDAASTGASVAAVVRGFCDHEPRLRVAGVVLNRVGSDSHEELLRDALLPIGIPVVGCLRRDDALVWRDRHLGLVPVAEHAGAVSASLDLLAAQAERAFDLETVLGIACGGPTRAVHDVTLPPRVGPCRIAVAGGPAFTFSYRDNLEALEAAGAELVGFDPLCDVTLPKDVDGLLIGGGFPEVYGRLLSSNVELLSDARTRIEAGLPTWAECGGLLWLADRLDGEPMAGILTTSALLGSRLVLGYREAETRTVTPIGATGTRLRGHEFHYSTCSPTGDALQLTSRFVDRLDGFATETMLATYLHVHAGGDPTPFEAFTRACVKHQVRAAVGR